MEFEKLQLEHESLKQRLASLEVVPASNGEAGDVQDGEDEVNPWDVKASSDKGVDYEKLIIR